MISKLKRYLMKINDIKSLENQINGYRFAFKGMRYEKSIFFASYYCSCNRLYNNYFRLDEKCR